MIRIAVAKGRIANDAIKLFEKHNIFFPDLSDTRKLVVADTTNQYEIFLVKPSDTAIYVEQGVADCGIVGRDILMEDDPGVFRLFPLDIGVCKMCVVGYADCDYKNLEKPVVATKFVNSAKNYFEMLNKECEIIKLNGSVELAPILKMSDVIVDIVQTGKTLVENGLSVLDDIYDISSVFIANKVALKTKKEQLMLISEIFGQKVE